MTSPLARLPQHRVAKAGVALVVIAVFVSACGGAPQSRQRNSALGSDVTVVFDAGEDQIFVVPEGVTEVDVSLMGAEGGVRTSQESVGSGSAGRGGVVTGRMTVTPGESLMVQPGRKGMDEAWMGAYPDGGMGGYPGPVYNPKDPNEWYYTWNRQGSGGGGSSRLWRGEQLVAVAGGGGGAGERSDGGHGGLIGGSADSYGGGGGATQDAPGAAGCTPVDFDGTKVCSIAGSYLMGGSPDIAGSGGGGGYFGGGGGSAVLYAGSGGGGSSWAHAESFTGDVSYRTGERTGDGLVTITYFDPAALPQTTLTPTTTTAPLPVLPCRWGGPCSVGDIGPGGGTVFFNATSPWNGPGSGPYLEVSTEDVVRLVWCNQLSTPAQKANDVSIGGGKLNQDAIVKVCSSGAAKTMADATWGGMTDWWLPNTMELTLMSWFFQRQHAAAIARDQNDWSWYNWPPVSCNGLGYLWSSNQVNTADAVMFRLTDGAQFNMGKDADRCSVGIRLFQHGDSSPLPMPTTTTSSTTTVEPVSTTATPTSDSGLPPVESTTNVPTTVPSTAPVTVPRTATTVSPSPQTTSGSPAPTVSPGQSQDLDEAREIILPPRAPEVTPQKFAAWVPVPQLQATKPEDPTDRPNLDTPSQPEVGEFSIVGSAAGSGRKPALEFGIRLPKRSAKSIVHTVTVIGDQVKPASTCTVTFTNTSKAVAKYAVRTKCRTADRKLTILAKKKSYSSGARLRLTVDAVYGAVALEIRSVVKGVSGTPKRGIWRSRWVYVR